MRVTFFLFALCLITACGPVYETRHDFVAPKTQQGQICAQNCAFMNQSCQLRNAQCKGGCKNVKQMCETNERLFKTNEQLSAQQGRAVGISHSSYDCANDLSSCEKNCEFNCMNDYIMCYHGCGGQVHSYHVCVYGCDRGTY